VHARSPRSQDSIPEPGGRRSESSQTSRPPAPTRVNGVRSPEVLLALQRAAGNRAVTRLMTAPLPAVSVQCDNGPPSNAPTQAEPRPAGPGPGVRASGDVGVAAGSTMTAEAALREVYARSAREISETARDMIRAGTTPDEAARWAVNARNELKTTIRQRGSAIVKGLAEARNVRKYGNKVGPTYDELIRQGKTPEDIIGKSGRASTKVNRFSGSMRIGGWLLIAVDVVIVTWEVYEAEEGQGLRTAIRGGGGIAGALAGGWLGMKGGAAVGGAIGLWFGGAGAAPGAAIGGFIGGVGGAIGGGILGRWGAGAAYDLVEELFTPNIDAQMGEIDAVEDAYIRSAR
jgi:hypothetical protein